MVSWFRAPSIVTESPSLFSRMKDSNLRRSLPSPMRRSRSLNPLDNRRENARSKTRCPLSATKRPTQRSSRSSTYGSIGARLEKLGIYAKPHKLQLAPMRRLGDLHELTAAMVADAKDEARMFYLLFQAELLNFIELFRSVNGNGVGDLPGDGGQHSDGRDRSAEVNV